MDIDRRSYNSVRAGFLHTHAVILPRKGILELMRLLENSEHAAHVQIGTNNLRIDLGSIIFTSKLIDVIAQTIVEFSQEMQLILWKVIGIAGRFCSYGNSV